MRIAVVVGNPKPASRTLSAALAVADATQAALGISERVIVDLATYGGALLDWSATEVTELNTAVACSQLVIIASPTYTGLLKVFLDRYGNNGLERPAIDVTGGADVAGVSLRVGARTPA